MAHTLLINACVRPDSRTLDLAKDLLEKLSDDVREIDLYNIDLQPLNTDDMEKRVAANKIKDFSDKAFDLAKEFAAADTIVIAAPFWDLLFPAVLRTYLERICVSGITFKYSPQGAPIGLCKAKKLYYVTTAGGFLGENNFGYMYTKALSQNLLGIEDVACISAEGLDINPEKADEILAQAKKNISL